MKNWAHLDFLARLRALLHDTDPEVRELAAAIGKSPGKALAAFLKLTEKFEPARKEGGRPTKWGDQEILMAWVAVETQVRLARRKRNSLGVKAIMDEFFGKRAGPKLGEGLYLASYPHLKISTAGRAKRLHDDGKKLLKRSAGLSKLYHDILDAELVRAARKPA